MQWHYVVDGRQTGPFEESDFQKLIDNNTVTDETMVWHEGMSEWSSFGSLENDPSVASESVLPEPTATNGACRSCGRTFPTRDMVPYEGTWICAACKPAFFQKIQEGVAGTGGNTPNADLMTYARDALQGSWGIAIGFLVVFQLIQFACQLIPFAGLILLLIAGPMSLGVALFFLALTRGEEVRMGMMFHGFQRFGTTFLAYFLVAIFTFLWSLLLIVPGILAAYSYRMTFYILADNENIGAKDAIQESKEIMWGNRWKFFCLDFRFVGWALLCVLTLGIGFLWLGPYVRASFARFYEDVKRR